MTRMTAAAAMILCCAGAAFAQSSACCAAKAAKAETVAQQVNQADKTCDTAKTCDTGKTCPVTGAAQTVAQQTNQAQKTCDTGKTCSDKGEAAVAMNVSQQTKADGACCASKDASPAQQVAAKTGACSEGVQAAGGCSGAGKVAALAADMPALQRKVGDEVTTCPVRADELAQNSGQPVMYVVGQRSFQDASQASQAYAAELTSYLDKATRVTFAVDGECVPCPDAASKACSEGKTMTYRVAGRDFTSAEAAVRAAAMAYAASRQVNLNYEVDGECAGSCEDGAKAKSMASAEPVIYRVGDRKTQCDVQASVMLAVARIEAAVTAVQAVPQS